MPPPRPLYCFLVFSDGDREKTNLNNPRGYFRTMCDNLNITVIPANSPQAKGRVERGNGTYQDKLVKLMRLKSVTNIDEANKYLEKEYIEEHNRKFALQIISA
ncbi:MAG: hypothetical protein LBG48_01265 [Rickettsiales bacterium]|jgi:hypothetical protein|nr:hypothetical protein [Rickettsiales bacterium]